MVLKLSEIVIILFASVPDGVQLKDKQNEDMSDSNGPLIRTPPLHLED